MRCNINGQPFSNKLKTFSTGNVNASNQFNCRKIWWKRIRKANETKRMERNQMKRNNEIDLYIFFSVHSFDFSCITGREEEKNCEENHSLDRPMQYNHRKQSIIVNFLQHFFVSLVYFNLKGILHLLQFILAYTHIYNV